MLEIKNFWPSHFSLDHVEAHLNRCGFHGCFGYLYWKLADSDLQSIVYVQFRNVHDKERFDTMIKSERKSDDVVVTVCRDLDLKLTEKRVREMEDRGADESTLNRLPRFFDVWGNRRKAMTYDADPSKTRISES